MRQKPTILFIVLSAILISCGTNKNLQLAESQVAELQRQNKELADNITALNKQVSELSTRNQSMAEEYASYKTKCEANEEKLIALREMLKDEADNLEKVREKIQEAMADFENRGVDIYTKDGLIYVSLAEELLYKSGSAKLGNSGKEALGTLASVLNDYPKLKVIVVGNTDTVRVKGVADNWSLSTERANGVVRILAKDYSVDPSRLTAAGKGKFNPVADNASAEGRAKNRRTDIILNPDLERIWQSVKE